MKVYWSEGRGCLITSANLSRNAFGAYGLKEVGVLLRDSDVDIDRLLAQARPRVATDQDLRKLLRAEKRAKQALAASGVLGRDPRMSFSDWFQVSETSDFADLDWKLGWCQGSVAASTAAKRRAKSEFNRKEPSEYMNCAKGQVRPHDWLLCFQLRKHTLTNFYWMYVDELVPVLPTEKGIYEQAYPYQAIQFRTLQLCPTPPFTIDKAFQKAFRTAANRNGYDWMTNRASLAPPKQLLREVAASIRRPS
jgi:hypothetical protein